MRILITGGAGFVGSSLASLFLRQTPKNEFVVLDNLRRRGSELNLARLRDLGARFYHGDIRCISDLSDLPGVFDLLIEASAEPSVHAGQDGSPDYVLQSNLVGTLNCLEYARKNVDALIFMSTSRVYSIGPLRAIKLVESDTRFEIAPDQTLPGIGHDGISEEFPNHLHRSFYGATKLCSEMILQEYVASYGLRAVTNRCSVITGPGQFGKVDQGVFGMWVAAHCFDRPLTYTGFGGTGKQVRDLLHPRDLFELINLQLEKLDECAGASFNVGGGTSNSTSLLEFTDLCREATGCRVPVSQDEHTQNVDVPLYITDCAKVSATFGWHIKTGLREIVEETSQWVRDNDPLLRELFT